MVPRTKTCILDSKIHVINYGTGVIHNLLIEIETKKEKGESSASEHP